VPRWNKCVNVAGDYNAKNANSVKSVSTFKVAVASLNFYDEGNITYGTSVITADITDLVLRLALTFLSSAVPIACSSSFVLVGSWPAMIFVGRTVRLIPVMTSTTDNSQQSLAGAEKAKPSLITNPEQAALRGAEKAKPSLIRNPEQAALRGAEKAKPSLIRNPEQAFT